MKRKRMAFRKGFLLSGILLFSVLVLGQLGWACDESDHPHYLCSDEPDIDKVTLDYDSDVIIIHGGNFEAGSHPPWVFLGKDRLPPISNTDEIIKVVFPPIDAGDYKLTVVTGETRHCRDKQSVKIAHDNKPSCPQPTCPEGCKGDKGDPGPQGPAGGIANFEIVKAEGTEVVDTPFFEGTVYCRQGFIVTGGGFFSNDLNVTISGPFEFQQSGVLSEIDNGWRVEGTTIGQAPFLQIWAVCVQAK